MKLSVITINRNNAEGLKQTVISVINQSFTDFEYIVIDGGSTDGSVDIIEEYTDKITYWVSEPDKGIYNAMNKGIIAASGDYLLMLNSGDYFVDEKVLAHVFETEMTEDIIYGNILWKLTNGKLESAKSPTEIKFSYLFKVSLFHQGTFVKKSLHDIVGLYDENFKIISDWAFWVLAFCRYNCTYKYIDFDVSVCDREGISCINENQVTIQQEKEFFLKTQFPTFYIDYVDYYYLKDIKESNKFLKIRRFIRKFFK